MHGQQKEAMGWHRWAKTPASSALAVPGDQLSLPKGAHDLCLQHSWAKQSKKGRQENQAVLQGLASASPPNSSLGVGKTDLDASVPASVKQECL